MLGDMQETAGLICRFSFLKRCSYSLYSDTMLDIGYILNETNTDVRMYICRIYSSRDLDTLLHKVELNMHWKNAGLYTLTTKD